MSLDILTRFNFSEREDSPLKGRAYVFESNFDKAFRSDVEEAKVHLGEAIMGHNLDVIKGFKNIHHTNAILWGSPEGDKMIDFLGWDYGFSFKDIDKSPNYWSSNPSIRSWVTRNGVIVDEEVPKEVTCEKGFIIMSAEGIHRLNTKNITEYLSHAPSIEGLVYTVGDFS